MNDNTYMLYMNDTTSLILLNLIMLASIILIAACIGIIRKDIRNIPIVLKVEYKKIRNKIRRRKIRKMRRKNKDLLTHTIKNLEDFGFQGFLLLMKMKGY